MFRSIMAGMARAAVAAVRVVGRPVMQAAERLIPQGAGELANGLYANHGYQPVAP